MDQSHIREIPLFAAVLTVSSSRNEETDTSGQEARRLFEEAGIPVVFYKIVPDDIAAIRDVIFEACAEANCVVLSGGTGLTHDDCTIEAVFPLFERQIDGFGELFRMLSYEEIGTRCILSRADAGLIGKSAVFCTPGSTPAIGLALTQIILPEIRHILTHASQ